MTIEQALEEAGSITGGCDVSERTARATMVLAAEVRRLRAGVEAVRALPRLSVKFRRGFDDDYSLIVDESGDLCDIDDVLAALEESK